MVDRTRIDELIAEIGEDDIGIVFSLFFGEAERMIDRIENGMSETEHAKATHFLRSGALNIGMVSLAKAADVAARAPVEAQAETAADLRVALADAKADLESLNFHLSA